MAIRIIQLGSARAPAEGPRIGAVRRPPRGVPRKDFARLDYYDLWLPELAPDEQTMKLGKAVQSERDWAVFARKYQAEMAKPGPARLLELLAALSRQANFSLGCYCQNQERCHRSVLGQILAARGADLSPEPKEE